MAVTFKRDSAGIAQILKSPEIAAAVRRRAEGIAAQISGVEVVVDSYTTDRAAASVTIRDRRGQAMQANEGVLTRAAAAQGLEVTER